MHVRMTYVNFILTSLSFCIASLRSFHSFKALSRHRYHKSPLVTPRKSCFKMSMESSKQPHRSIVIILSGATSAGKSAVARELCKTVDAEIIIADSVQVYRDLDIGSNKPSIVEQNEVRHHLVDIVDTSTVMTAADFCERAREAITRIVSRGKVPIIVGGSTMWIQWLKSGIPDAPKPSEAHTALCDKLLEDATSRRSWTDALAVLQQYDANRAAKLATNDWYRLRRYLEVSISMKGIVSDDELTSPCTKTSSMEYPIEAPLKAESDVHISGKDSNTTLTGKRKPVLAEYDVRSFFLSEKREDLYRTIDSRCVGMLEAGLISETADLVRKGILRPEYPISKSIGYRQAIDYLIDDSVSSADTDGFKKFASDFATATRNYAKRQINWYRKDREFLFLRIDRTDNKGAVFATTLAEAAMCKEAAALSTSTTSSTSSNEPLSENNDKTSDSKYIPYKKVATELLHFCRNSPEAFSSALERQVNWGLLLSRLKNMKYLPHDYEIQSTDERAAIAWLLSEGSLKIQSSKMTNINNGGQKKGKATVRDYDSLGNGEANDAELKKTKIVSSLNIPTSSEPPSSNLDNVNEIDIKSNDSHPLEAKSQLLPVYGTISTIHDPAYGITPANVRDIRHEWSAQEFDIRVQEGTGKSSAVRTYQSILKGPEANKKAGGKNVHNSHKKSTTTDSQQSPDDVYETSIKRFIEERDRCRATLIDTVPAAVAAFQASTITLDEDLADVK